MKAFRIDDSETHFIVARDREEAIRIWRETMDPECNEDEWSCTELSSDRWPEIAIGDGDGGKVSLADEVARCERVGQAEYIGGTVW